MILVVDNNPEAAGELASLLRASGYGVRCARTAAEAVAVTEGGSVGLIVCDLLLPDASAFDLLALVRAAAGGVDVPVVVSARPTPDQEARLYKVGVAACVQRNDGQVLLRVVHTLYPASTAV